MKFTISTRLWRNYYRVNRILLFILAAFILLMLFPHGGKFKYEFQKAKPWPHEDLIAPFDFAILKPDAELAAERKAVVKEAALYFKFDNDRKEYAKSDFLGSFETQWQKITEGDALAQARKEAIIQKCFAIFDTIYNRGIVQQVPQLEAQNADIQIAVLKDNVAEYHSLGDFLMVNQANGIVIRMLASFSAADSKWLLPIMQSSISHNVIYDDNMTVKHRDQMLAEISPTRGMVQRDQRIIAKGEVVDDAKFQQIESLRREFESRSGYSFNFGLITLGRLIMISMALMVFALFMFTFRRDIFLENRNIVLLLMLITLMVSFTTLVLNINSAYIMAVPICMVPIMVRTFYDTRMALFVHIITIITLGFLVPNSFEFLFMQLITGIITIISVVKLHNRSQFFFTSLMIFISYSIIYIGMVLMQDGSVQNISRFNFLLFAMSALLTLFSYPLIYIFERIFGMVTDVSLIELSDTNSKLLRELAITAPGTFQHSLIVSNIAEEAARAINANSLLARTGSLYHDIGKMEMPLYFIENQSAGINPHDELTYEESARIITGHVIKGIEKARKHNLPNALIDFIRTHHGTRHTGFFYQKQLEEANGQLFDEEPFTYRGPIPFSKETAILMMADSIEAASRSLRNPTEDQVNELVEKLIGIQMERGQFRNAPLTLKEINIIKKIIKKKLLSIYHIRIEYPS